MEIVIYALWAIIGLGSLYCAIMEIVAAFKHGDGPLMGILSLVFCGLGGFIIGWIHAKKWNITGIMKLWSVLIVLSIITQILFMVLVAPTLMEGLETVPPAAY